MSHSLDVQVLNSDGEPVSGVKVEIEIEGIWKGGSLQDYTDSDGHASFETADDYPGYTKLTIHVEDEYFGPYYISGGAYTVTLASEENELEEDSSEE
jgi:hypothetical protein